MFRPRATTRVFALLCGLSFLLYLDRVNLSTAASFVQKELRLSNLELGIAFSAFAYSYLVTQIIGGVIADKFGPRWTLLGCVSIWVVTTIATGFVGSLAALFAVRLALGIGEGAALPAAARAITNWFPVDKRGMAQGVTHSFSRFGNAVAPPVVALLITLTDWRTSFIIVGIGTAVWLVFWYLGFRDHPTEDPGITQAELDRLPPRAEVAPQSTRKDPIPWRRLLKRIAPSAAVYFCYGWTGWLYFTWLPSFFLHAYKYDIKSSSMFVSGVFFAGVVGDAMGGILADRIFKQTGSLTLSRSVLISATFVASAICLVPVLASSDLTIMTLSLSAAFFFIEMSIAPIWMVPMDVAPAYAGTASGIINAGSAVAGIVSPILFGFIIDRTGSWTAPFVGSVVLLLLGAVLAFTIRPEVRLGTDDNATPGALPAVAPR
ncbi:MAG TPA: MFS transporter [Aliidongia sp.]|uniref:MFS transporter n=1 Tax=Aliidongia sp. TaxID=1914230 RepID=UPI002DDD01C0|nr:MFS transporter [Aliidongia sp.]HEV2674956.1 MFS transporter [Aliidongia sp.]